MSAKAKPKKSRKSSKKGARKPAKRKGGAKRKKTQVASARRYSMGQVFISRKQVNPKRMPPLTKCAADGKLNGKRLIKIVPLSGRQRIEAQAREVAKFQRERAAKNREAEKKARKAAVKAAKKPGATPATVQHAYEASIRANPYAGMNAAGDVGSSRFAD